VTCGGDHLSPCVAGVQRQRHLRRQLTRELERVRARVEPIKELDELIPDRVLLPQGLKEAVDGVVFAGA
jgi:hypothetical protein